MRLAVPPETQAGDLLLATVTARLSSRGRISPQGGWRRVRETSNVGGPALTQAVYYKFADASDPGRLQTWHFSSAAGAAGGVLAFGGVDPDAPIQAASGKYSANSRYITAAPLVTVEPDSLVAIREAEN